MILANKFQRELYISLLSWGSCVFSLPFPMFYAPQPSLTCWLNDTSVKLKWVKAEPQEGGSLDPCSTWEQSCERALTLGLELTLCKATEVLRLFTSINTDYSRHYLWQII